MSDTIRRRALWLALALSVALAAPPGVGQAADEPDLKLEDVRMFASADGQVSESVVQFKVTNVGNADALDWTGRLEVTGPPPVPEPGEPFTVEKLEKNGGVFQGRLPLPVPCDGTVVRLWVQAPGETNFADNTVEGLKLCPDKPPPAPAPSGNTGPRHVPYAATLRPTEVWWQHRTRIVYDADDPLCYRESVTREEYPFGMAPVGFSNIWTSDECGAFEFYQARVVFDVSDLAKHPLVGGRVAKLSYEERPVRRGGPPARGHQAYTCVAGVRIASSPEPVDHGFAARPEELYRDGLLASDPWSVAEAVDGWVFGRYPNHGLVLFGWDQTFNARERSSCLSHLLNFELDVAAVWLVP